MTVPFKPNETAEIGIIGGSGFYDLAENLKEIKVETPYGSPSDKLAIGKIAGKKMAFLPRHSKTHDIPPHKINYRANLYALYSLGVREIITSHACGSLQSKIKPGSVVVLDQFVDRTWGRQDTFFDGPYATHISMAHPYCGRLRKHAIKTINKLKIPVHEQGAVVVIQGPRFSTSTESLWFTNMGWEVINMTQYPETALARELQMCYCALAFPTDFDAGIVAKGLAQPVSAKEIVRVFKQNVNNAKGIMLEMIKNWPTKTDCECQDALTDARF